MHKLHLQASGGFVTGFQHNDGDKTTTHHNALMPRGRAQWCEGGELLLRRRGPRLRDWRDTERWATDGGRSPQRPSRERRRPGKGGGLTIRAALATAEAALDEATLTFSALDRGELHTDIPCGRASDDGARSASPPSTTTGAAAKSELRQAAISALATGPQSPRDTATV